METFLVYSGYYLLIGCLIFLYILLVDIHAYHSQTSWLILSKEEFCQSTKYNFLSALIWPSIPYLIFKDGWD